MTVPSGKLLARFVPDRFMQFGSISGKRVDRLQSSSARNRECLRTNACANRWRVFAFAARGGKAKLKIIDNRDESLEQRMLAYLIASSFSARATFFVILEVGLVRSARSRKAIKIGLQPSIGSSFRFGLRSRSRPASSGETSIFLRAVSLSLEILSCFADGNQGDVVICGCDPTKLRRSSISRATMAWAPLSARPGPIERCVRRQIRFHRYQRSSLLRPYRDQAIIALQRTGKSPVILSRRFRCQFDDHAGRLQRRDVAETRLLEKRRLVSSARERDAVARVIEMEIGHADEHVLL